MTNVTNLPFPAEQFDLNQVELEGVVQRIWDRSGDVYFRLAVDDELRIDQSPAQALYVTCRLKGEQAAEEGLSLQPGEAVRVLGLLVDSPYHETLQQFLGDAKAAGFFAALSDQPGWSRVQVPRVSTLVEILTLIPMPVEKGRCMNRATVQGIVSKVWERGGNLLARLAVYDDHTRLAGKSGNRSRPRRIPHYLTLLFLDGQAGGRPLHLAVKNRLRASGALTTRFYRESLKEVLLRTQNLHLLENLPNSDRAEDIAALRTATYLAARSAIVFASLSSHPQEVSTH